MPTTSPLTEQTATSFVDDEPLCGYSSKGGDVIVNVLWGASRFDPYHPLEPTLGSGATTAVSGLGHPAAANDDEVAKLSVPKL